ncbi:hypothetical protein [Ectobacillus ponti]|uniref:Uncharacterized protein n=1 Tax=Ectobacillus ponti TaxID=2961894 RepID=A0AA41X4P8_9BACI|nr:hypothetical protein [Ectobacillus ponti]MCP8968702.1 hypothetical protein [Ectobacillus ponti]
MPDPASRQQKKERVHVQREVSVSPTGTISAAGEMAQGALGGFSFDEMIGQDIFGDEE